MVRAFEDGVGVGTVARVAHSDRRCIIGIAQFWIIAAENLDCALYFVNDTVRGERRKVNAETSFQLYLQFE